MVDGKLDTVEACIDAVEDAWSTTQVADRWMVFHAHLDENDRLGYTKTECNFRKGDAYISVAMLARMIGRDNGHSDEFLDKFTRQLIEHIWSTVGRPPLVEPLPLASHLQLGGVEADTNGTIHLPTNRIGRNGQNEAQSIIDSD